MIPPIPRKRTAIQVLDATTIDGNKGAIVDVSYHDRDMESFEMLSNDRLRSGSVNRRSSIRNIKPSPAPRRSIQRSASNLNKIGNESVSFTRPTVNPRSFQKGLLGVVSTTSSSTNLSPSRIPRRKSSVSTPSLIIDHHQSSPRHYHYQHQPHHQYERSASSSRKNSLITSSTDRLNVRRDSSTYSGRRTINNDFGGSMIDLGVTPSNSRSMNRISKPTTLSPIVGTPNKDCECDSNSSCRHHTGHHRMDGYDRHRYNSNDTMTKIPIRRSSSVSINTNRTSSRSNSRETSPPKSNRSSPTKIPQKINQKTPSPSKVAKNHIANSTTTTTTTTTEHTTKAGPNNTVNKEQSSAKKEPTINHEKSSVKKPPAGTAKPESSTLKRQPSNVKRENSQHKLKRENSTIGGAKQAAVKPTAIRKEPSLLKNQSDSSLTKRLEKKNSFKQKRRTSSESDGLNEIGNIKAPHDLTALTKQLTNGTKHLNGVSMTTAAVAAQPIQITTAVTDHLSKTSSSSQIVINGTANGGSDGNNNTVIATNNMNNQNVSTKTDDTKIETTTATIITTPMITEPNQNADKIATITEPMAMSNESSDNTSKVNGTNEMQAPEKGNATMAVLQKKASTRTLKIDGFGTPITTIESGQKAVDNTAIDSPIETKVNVIDNVLGDSVNGGDRMLLKSGDNADEMHAGMSTQPMELMVNADGQDNGDINTHEDPNGAKIDNG